MRLSGLRLSLRHLIIQSNREGNAMSETYESLKIRWADKSFIFIRERAAEVLESGGYTFEGGALKRNPNNKLDEEMIESLLAIVDACNEHLHG